MHLSRKLKGLNMAMTIKCMLSKLGMKLNTSAYTLTFDSSKYCFMVETHNHTLDLKI